MFNFFKPLVNSGVGNHPDPYLKRTTRFVNLFSIITIIGLLIGFTNVFFLKQDFPIIPETSLFVFSIAILILNTKRFYNAAIYTFLFSVNFSLFYLNEYYDRSSAPFLYYFPLILCVALLHNPSAGIKKTISYFIISSAFITISLLFDFDFMHNAGITTENNQLLFIYNLGFGIALSVLLVIMFINVINKQNHELIDSLNKEKSNQEKLSASLNEKEVLLQEIHHRVKNNLSVISSLLNLQINNATQTESRQLLTDARNRVLSMSLVHQKLYRVKELNKIQFDKYITELSRELLYASPLKDSIRLNEMLETCELDISKAVPLGLIANEIITNSIKHGFKAYTTNGQITVSLQQKQDRLYLSISDNGPGFDFEKSKTISGSLGLSLIESLVEQIDGTFSFQSKNGSHYELSISLS